MIHGTRLLRLFSSVRHIAADDVFGCTTSGTVVWLRAFTPAGANGPKSSKRK